MRRKLIALMGKWTIYGPQGNKVFYCEQQWSLKAGVHIYADSSKRNEVLRAKTKQILDFSATYDILDPATNEKIGAVRRKGLKSLLGDEWLILDKDDREIGLIKEDNIFFALARRLLLGWLFPKRYSVFIGGVPVALFRKLFNPFIWKTSIDFSQDVRNLLDKRIGIASAILMCAVGERSD